MWFGTFTHTCTARQGMVAGTCHLQGRQPLTWGRSPVSFKQISQPLFFSWWLLTWFPTFTRTCTASRGMVVGTCDLQGRHSLPWGRSPVSFGQIGLGVVFQGKSWDKGPSSLALPRMVHHPWPAAPDMIWHIYSHLYCSSRDVDRYLPSSGEAAPTMGKVSCEFGADQLGCSFSGEELRQGSFQPCPAQDGASSMAGGCGHDLAHLLTPVLLIKGW